MLVLTPSTAARSFAGGRRSPGFASPSAIARRISPPFGYYRITRLADGRAIGGLGFKGQPDGGCVEIGYGLAPSARGHGYAAEAVIALLTVAADQGCTRRARKRRRESHMADVVAIAGWSLAFGDDATPQGAGDVRRAASAEVAGMVI